MKRAFALLVLTACHADPPPMPVAPHPVVDAGAPVVSPPSDKAGLVTYGAIVVSGKGDRDAIVGILHAQAKPFQACYERTESVDAGVFGRVLVRFQIDSTGAVTNARADRGSDIEDPGLQACLVGVVSKLPFPAGSDGNPVGVIAPIIFMVGVPASD